MSLPEPAPTVLTADDCVAFVDRVDICTWQRRDKLPMGMPSLEAATPWDGDAHALMNATWFWKDDLHIQKRLFYGQLLDNGIPTFVSLRLLPVLIAAQGDNDPRTLLEQNRLSRPAFTLYDHVGRNGPTPSNALPGKNSGERSRSLIPLQQHFILTKHGLTGRTRGTYGYLWGACDTFCPDAFRAAARLRVSDARDEIVACLTAQGVAIDAAHATKLFRWSEDG